MNEPVIDGKEKNVGADSGDFQKSLDYFSPDQSEKFLSLVGVILCEIAEYFSSREYDYWSIDDEINKRLQKFELPYAWKSHPGEPDYNSHLGILEIPIGNFIARVCVGLPTDNFDQPRAVLQLVPSDFFFLDFDEGL